jgi:hypothetical protein
MNSERLCLLGNFGLPRVSIFFILILDSACFIYVAHLLYALYTEMCIRRLWRITYGDMGKEDLVLNSSPLLNGQRKQAETS